MLSNSTRRRNPDEVRPHDGHGGEIFGYKTFFKSTLQDCFAKPHPSRYSASAVQGKFFIFALWNSKLQKHLHFKIFAWKKENLIV